MIDKIVKSIFGYKIQKQTLSKDSFSIDPGINTIPYAVGSGTNYCSVSGIGTFGVYDMGPPGDFDLGCKDENLEVKNDAIISDN